MAIEEIAGFTDIVFEWAAGREAYKTAFCVNPPDDVCPFGPCQNSDVTGIGQQISIYVTTVTYAIVLAYIPSLQRPMLYAHLSIVYSLHIAGLISILKTNLTQNDSIFVLISVASPTTIYLWYLAVRSCFNPSYFPIVHVNKHRSREVHVLRVLTLLSLIFEVVMIGLTFVPSDKINFSQPACMEKFGSTFWYNLAWQIPFLIQIAMSFAFFLVLMVLCWLWTMRKGYTVPHRANILDTGSIGSVEEFKVYTANTKPTPVDLVTWTERILFEQYPLFMNSSLFGSMVAILQLSVIPHFLILPVTDFVSVIILGYGLFRERAAGGSWKIYLIRTFILFIAVLVAVFRSLVAFIIPNIADLSLSFVAFSSALWAFSYFSLRDMKIIIPALLVMLVVAANAANVIIGILGSSKTFSPEAMEINAAASQGESINPTKFVRSVLSLFSIRMITICLWLVSWNISAFWPWKEYLKIKEYYQGVFARAHLLKFCLFITAPQVLWIQACVATDPSGSTDMTFGQIFAIIVSFVTLITLLDAGREVSRAVWSSFFKSRELPYEGAVHNTAGDDSDCISMDEARHGVVLKRSDSTASESTVCLH